MSALPGASPSAVQIDLATPRNYAAIPAGSPIILSVSGGTVTGVKYAVDATPSASLTPPYLIDTSVWETGTHVVRTWAYNNAILEASSTFVFFIDPTAVWPPDTTPMDIVLVGFDVNSSAVADALISRYIAPVQLTPGATTLYNFDLRFPFVVRTASSTYHQALLNAVRENATYRDALQARLNLTALIEQRNTGTPMGVFDSLVGNEIRSDWFESYLAANPPVPLPRRPGFTFYLVNMSAVDDPSQGIDHWFVRRTPDPDTGVDENWWRLEWDNPLNTPMGYPMDIFGGPNRTVVIDPTAYEWYLDWAHVWLEGGSGRAPYGLEYEEIPVSDRAVYLAELVNDLVAGLATVLPFAPPQEPAAELRTYVLSGSSNYTVDELRWVYSDGVLRDYLQREFLPYKSWVVNTTFSRIDDFPALKAVVDANTVYRAGEGEIDGQNVWSYLLGNRSLYLTPRADTFSVLSVAILYDNRSMVFDGRPFTGLGGEGVTTVFIRTNRLLYENGTREKGLTSLLAHELGHNLGYDHQFGPHFRADFVDGNMGYFRNELSYGTFWTDAMYRVLATAKLAGILTLLSTRGPIDLEPEFESFYREYDSLNLTGAYSVLFHLEGQLTDTVPPTANAGPDRNAESDVPITLDGSASADNYRVVNYSWNFGDGSAAWSWDPTVGHAWTFGGSYVVTLTVFDPAGNGASDTAIVTVVGPAPPPPPTNWTLVAGVGIGIAAAVVVAVVVILRLRKTSLRPPP